MGAFNINITGVGGHGCERKAKPGEKLWGRCGKFACPDCAAHDFVQRLKQAGMLREGDTASGGELTSGLGEGCSPPAGAETYWTDDQWRIVPEGDPAASKKFWKKPHQALFTHWPDSPTAVVDDMLKNERKVGSF
jgi:hypothetical protein